MHRIIIVESTHYINACLCSDNRNTGHLDSQNQLLSFGTTAQKFSLDTSRVSHQDLLNYVDPNLSDAAIDHVVYHC